MADEQPVPLENRRCSFTEQEQDRIEEAGKKFTVFSPNNKLGKKFKGLCFHCKHSFIVRAESMNEPIIYCQNISYERPLTMPDNVVECKDYQAITDMGLSAMAALAWPIDPRPDFLKDGYR